jgi:transcriptional regulator with XRE-family HTH domain
MTATSIRSIRKGAPARIGVLLRAWRTRRNLSQLALGLEAGVSARHLSFVECGRAKPSAGMILRLCETLRVPFSGRNELLLAAGYSPRFAESRDVAHRTPHESFRGTHGPGPNEQEIRAERGDVVEHPEFGQGSLAV